MSRRIVLCIAVIGVITSSRAETLKGSSVTLTSCDYVSGGRSTGITCRVDAGIGDIALTSVTTSSNGVNLAGLIGQLRDVIALELTASPSNVNEETYSALGAMTVGDDSTLEPGEVQWSVLSGPISSISSSGMALASAVYANTPATAQAYHPDASMTIQLLVLNSLKDNYGFYAGDQVDDAWQTAYFGPGNPNGTGSADADSDGQNNRLEFIAGTNPTNSLDAFEFAIGRVVQSNKVDLLLYPVFADRTYSIQARTNLLSGGWAALANTSHSTNAQELTISDLAATNRATFYRAVVKYDW